MNRGSVFASPYPARCRAGRRISSVSVRLDERRASPITAVTTFLVARDALGW